MLRNKKLDQARDDMRKMAKFADRVESFMRNGHPGATDEQAIDLYMSVAVSLALKVDIFEMLEKKLKSQVMN